MNPFQLDTAYRQFKAIKSPYQHLYVKKAAQGKSVVATYAVTDASNAIIFFKSVDVKTGALVDRGTTLDLNSEALKALDYHFSEEYVRTDGLMLMQELCVDAHSYPPEALPMHAVFGKCVYHADLDEVRAGPEAYINLYQAFAVVRA